MFECVIFDGPNPVWSGFLTAREVAAEARHTLRGVDEGFFMTFAAFRGEQMVLRTDLGEQEIRRFERRFELAEGL